MKAKKHLGQNFLTNQGIIEKIATATDLQDKHIIEVGPGHGALTRYLYNSNKKSLQLIELDTDLIPELEEAFSGENTYIHHGDVLKTSIHMMNDIPLVSLSDIKEFNTPDYTVFGNIPYYITSPILRHFLYSDFGSPNEMVILMQKEVADKILCTDGKHSVLSLLCHYRCSNIERICNVSPGSFDPAPKVHSTVLKFTIKPERSDLEKNFIKLIHAGFSEKRKKLSKNLEKSIKGIDWKAKIIQIGLNENIRAEDLKLEDWENLATNA